MSAAGYPHRWAGPTLPERIGTHYRFICGTKGVALIEFADGHRTVTPNHDHALEGSSHV